MMGWQLTIILILKVGVVFCSSSTPDKKQGYIVPGIWKEYVPQPIFYQGYIPLILEYQTPQWNKTDITYKHGLCVTDASPYRYTCALLFYFNKAVANLHTDFDGLHPMVEDDKSPGALQESHDSWDRILMSSDFCERIQPHFSGIYVTEEELEKYLEALKQCRIQWGTGNGVVFMQRNLSDYNYSLRQPFEIMEYKFFDVFFKNMASDEDLAQLKLPKRNSSSPTTILDTITQARLDLIPNGILVNTKIIMQTGMLGFFYAEKNRWIHATNDCLQKLIPQSLVTKAKFTEALKNISLAQWDEDSHQLSIRRGMISKYYSLPIADCSHTSNGKMAVVRIQIPILRKTRSKTLQLVHTHILPFEYKGHLCHINWDSSQKSRSQFGIGSKSFLYEESRSLAFPTTCRGNELCHVSEYALISRNNEDQCASGLLSMNHSIVKDHCQFQCRKEDLSETPLVTRVHPNQYVVTGSPLTIGIDCTLENGGKKGRDFFINPNHVGAHLVNIPCNCLMTIDKLKSLKFYGEGGCHLTEDDDFFKRTRTNNFHPEGKVMNPEVIPIIPVHFIRRDVNEISNSRVNLPDFLDLERLEGYLGVVGIRKEEGAGPDSTNCLTSCHPGTGPDSATPTNGSSLTALWTFVIILTTILFAIQGYMMIMFSRNVGTLNPKVQTMLYKVQDSPLVDI